MILGSVVLTLNLAVLGAVDGLFVPAPDMTFARYTASAAALPSGDVLLYGPSYDGDAYGMASGTWVETSLIPAPRFNAHLVALAGRGALLIGGDPTDPRTVRYAPETKTWTWSAPLTVARRFEVVATLADGRILVAGGFGSDTTPTVSAELYDPATGTFTATGAMPRPRAGGIAEVLPDGRVLVAGGLDATGNGDPCAVVYSPASGTFSSGPCFAAATHGRFAPASARLRDGRVLVSGGQTYFQGSTRLAPDADVYDPATNQWTQRFTSARFEHTLTTLDDGRVLAIGGVDDWNSPIATSEIFDPALDAFRIGPSLMVPRYGHTATALPGNRVLVAGGRISASEWTASTEIYTDDALMRDGFEEEQ
ncbi:MAG: hypothetical protein K8F35_14940 [Dokdonella sp.]|uniref:Kelch repeat-containing protein n=1 Tax=Dokdonella sp. TaxID=2291710 RepID=UPI0025C6A277|nr:kelch motif-containing protein [Dokdonella sp.]MBZ0224309.1 hypothetical protein [Dokdonella sp.]